jgi:hypothetical protein
MKILDIPLEGSLQNPAWSLDGKSISLTVWKSGYNEGDADVVTYNLDTKEVNVIATGGTNVSQPGRCWTSAGIILSTDSFEQIDWPAIYDFHSLKPITYQEGYAGYEPSWSPNNQKIVFERHVAGREGNGQIVIFDRLGDSFELLTSDTGDCRQPNYSNLGKIVWQEHVGDEWRLIVDGKSTGILGTDATFGPMERLVYSDNAGRLVAGNSIVIRDIYAGAPSWKDNRIVFETSEGDPDGGKGTKIAIIEV